MNCVGECRAFARVEGTEQESKGWIVLRLTSFSGTLDYPAHANVEPFSLAFSRNIPMYHSSLASLLPSCFSDTTLARHPFTSDFCFWYSPPHLAFAFPIISTHPFSATSRRNRVDAQGRRKWKLIAMVAFINEKFFTCFPVNCYWQEISIWHGNLRRNGRNGNQFFHLRKPTGRSENRCHMASRSRDIKEENKSCQICFPGVRLSACRQTQRAGEKNEWGRLGINFFAIASFLWVCLCIWKRFSSRRLDSFKIGNIWLNFPAEKWVDFDCFNKSSWTSLFLKYRTSEKMWNRGEGALRNKDSTTFQIHPWRSNWWLLLITLHWKLYTHRWY